MLRRVLCGLALCAAASAQAAPALLPRLIVTGFPANTDTSRQDRVCFLMEGLASALGCTSERVAVSTEGNFVFRGQTYAYPGRPVPAALALLVVQLEPRVQRIRAVCEADLRDGSGAIKIVRSAPSEAREADLRQPAETPIPELLDLLIEEHEKALNELQQLKETTRPRRR